MAEESPKPSHPRLAKPRVSFSADGNIGLGERNSALSAASETESEVKNGNGRSVESNIESIQEVEQEIEFSEIPVPIKSLNRRRVSTTIGGDAVIMRDVEKSYKSGHPILNGFNMTVPSGSIYGLLGSSGEGKTTALSILVGILKVDYGRVLLFGKKPGCRSIGIPGRNIGYMPQDISLYMEFSINETLTYFGILGGLTNDEIQSSKNFLVSLLDLPKLSRHVGSLSGGEQRRVSFASALIHEPELLILDEPTVGVDPLIRHKIWDHLRKLVTTKRTTVILSTHYIEECRQADNIGVMRSGRLLAERQPQELMSEYGSTNLEKIVLALSRKDTLAKLNPLDIAKVKAKVKNRSSDEESRSPEKGKEPEVQMAQVTREPDTGLMNSLTRIRALTEKNFMILLRNPLLLFFVLLIAALLMILICTCFGPDPKHMRVGLVNNELDYISTCPNSTRAEGECNVENLSCHFLQKIPANSIDLIVYDTEAEAASSVHDGSTWGFIIFPEGFSSALYERGASGTINVDDETLNASEIVVKLDESSKQISASIKKTLYDAYEDFIAEMLSDCGFDPRQGESALVYRKPIFGRDDTDFLEFIAPGATLALLFFFPIITSSIRFIKEKKIGVLHRSTVQGVKAWEVLIAYSISEFCLLLAQALLNYCIITFVFGIKILGSDILLILMYYQRMVEFQWARFLLGAVCSEEIEAALLAMAAFFPNFILSGLIWPREGMNEWLQYVVQVLPCTLASEATRSITSRGWEFVHPNVWPGCVCLVGYIIGYFILTVLFHVIFKK